MTGRRPLRWLPGGVAALSAAMVLISNLSGLAVSDDGIGYLAIAARLSDGRGLGWFLEERLTTWPPLFPWALSLGERVTPLDLHGVAVLLNAVTAGVTTLVFAALLRRVCTDGRILAIGIVVAGLGASTMLFGHLLTSDFAVGAVALGALVLLLDANTEADGRRVGLLAAAGLCLLVGFGLRYATIALTAPAALWLLVQRGSTPTRRLRDAISFVAPVLVGAAAWMARNHAVDGTWLGPRWPSARGLEGNIADALAATGNLLAPGVWFERRGLWLAVALLVGAATALAAWRAVRAERAGGATTLTRRVRGLVASRPGLLALVVAGYLAYLVGARTMTAFDRLSFRLLEPIALTGAALCLALADRVIRGDSLPWRRLARGSVVAWGALSVALGVAMVPYFATGPDLFAGNYERAAFVAVRSSPVLRSLPDDCSLESNLPAALYEAGVEAQWSPRRTPLNSDVASGELAAFERHLERRDVCVVWIDLEPHFDNVIPLRTLAKRASMRTVDRDGPLTVYRFSAPHDRG